MASAAIVSASGGRRGRRRRAVMSEINVTPFVDVMLVLLIIFMVTAPLMTLSIKVDLPDARGGTVLNSNNEPLILTLKKSDGSCNSKVNLFLGHSPVTLPEVQAKLQAIKAANPQAQNSNVMVNSDRDVCYEEVMKLLGRLRDAGMNAALNVVPEKE